MARRNTTPRLKDQKNKPRGLKEQGKIKTYNSFDPLTKFDSIFSLCNDYVHNKKTCPLKRREARREDLNTDKCGLALCAHSDENHWLVDNGFLIHMTCDKKSLSH